MAAGNAAQPIRSADVELAKFYGSRVLLGGGLRSGNRDRASVTPFISELPLDLQAADGRFRANGADRRGSRRDDRGAGAVWRRFSSPDVAPAAERNWRIAP